MWFGRWVLFHTLITCPVPVQGYWNKVGAWSKFNTDLASLIKSMYIISHIHPWISSMMRVLHPWMTFTDYASIHVWGFSIHVWLSFVHPCAELSSITFCSHRLPIVAKIASKLCETWAKSDGWQFNPWISKSHPWMKVLLMDESIICGCHPWMVKSHPWMKMTDDGHGQNLNLSLM